jgi:hypothetical protein
MSPIHSSPSIFGGAISLVDAKHSDFVVKLDDMPPLQYSNAIFEFEGSEALLSSPVDLVVEGAIRNPHVRSRAVLPPAGLCKPR